MILELGISELNALIGLLDDQGAGAISAEDGLGQDVGGRISQAVLLAAGQLDDLVSLEVAGQRGVANLLDPAGILHEVAGVNGMGVTNLGIAQEQGLIADQTDSQLSADIARRIQDEMTYPGQVKITVIRETRSVSYAK